MEELFVSQRIVLFIDHHDIRYLSTQKKLNNRHMKLVKFLQNYTFVMKHNLRNTNKVTDVLGQRVALLGMMTIQSTRLDSMKADYEVNRYSNKAWKELREPCSFYKNPYMDYFIQESYLFRGHRL